MSFIADKQTLEDLNLLGKYKNNSIFNLFNQVVTPGGESLLENMFQNPLDNAEEINRRSTIFQYFQSRKLTFPCSAGQFALMENYLHNETGKNLLVIAISTFKKQLLALTVRDEEYGKVLAGINATVSVLKLCRDFIVQLKDLKSDHPYFKQLETIQSIFADKRLAWLKTEQYGGKLSVTDVVKLESLFRNQLIKEMRTLLQTLYYLDVYIAVGNLAASKSFTYAEALLKERNEISAEELRHPGLENAIGNSVSFHQQQNLVFLTGANMAGKSTFMKTFGISVYLAHMGFPVAAKQMKFSIKDGIYSSINVPDNLNMGLSHFYAEVLRVKQVAEEVSAGKDLLVIFDELFKGTNVKDAYDATLAVTESFAQYRNCMFIISTHIIEVGEALKGQDQIQFLYLPTVMEGNVPRYTYQLQEGITTDRQGMMIIENEGILEILKD